jgi:hypothetical protein
MADSPELHLISFHVQFQVALIFNSTWMSVGQIITICYMVLDNALIQSFTLMTTLHVLRLWQSPGKRIYHVCQKFMDQAVQNLPKSRWTGNVLQGEERHNFLKRHTDTAWTDAAKIGSEEWYKFYGRAYHPEVALLDIRVLLQVISASSSERNWSAHGHIHSEVRDRLAPAPAMTEKRECQEGYLVRTGQNR